jgi:quinol monooxygenase YgiN
MIIRIVKLHLKSEMVPAFRAHFDGICNRIRSFEGCRHLELLSQEGRPEVLFTYSHWDSVDYLNKYLESAFFKDTWQTVKPMFDAPAAAWSLKSEVLVTTVP